VNFEPLDASNERDWAEASLYALGQDISRFSHDNSTKVGGGVDYIKTCRWTNGIKLESSAFGDRIEKRSFHLESLELEEHAKKMKERVPTEEEDPREVTNVPLR
jgi:hypothetical protein